MKIPFILSVLLLAFQTSFAQKGYYENYDWSKTPQKYEISADDLKEDEVIVFEKRSIQVLSKNEEFVQMQLVHHITLLNTDKAIEENNKFYISTGAESTVLVQKARVIKPGGEIIELKQADIKESKDENGNVEYRYFAFDGIEKGSYIEYLHYVQRSPTYTGAVMTVQSSINKKSLEFDIICPAHIEYQIYPINGMAGFYKDSTNTEVTRMVYEVQNLPGLKDEDWTAYESLLQKCYYKLQKNLDNNTSNFYTYTNITKIIHTNMYEPASKKAKKAMAKFIKEACPDPKASLETRVRQLENKMKTTIAIVEVDVEGSFDVASVLDMKVTDEEGLTKLMVQLLREMGIAHELVMTSDRNSNPFISEFEGYNFLSENLVYINELDMYWSPGFLSRLGFPPFSITNTKGLFIKEVTINDLTTGISKVKTIKGTKSDQSVDEINTTVSFESDLSDCSIQFERIATGYKAEFPQVAFDYVNDEQKQEFRDQFLKYIDMEATLENATFENDNTAACGSKPLIGRATIKGSAFIEKAGDKTLLKAGLLIGPQAQMYHKEERRLPVETAYTRQYRRKIVINIPEGQMVKNPEDLVFNITPDTQNNSAGFVSSYELKGNQLVVTVFEYYNETSYPVSQYFIYENVMNAAADFNKVVLVMDKI